MQGAIADDCMGRDLLLDNRSLRCSTSCIHAVVQSLHSRHPWRSCRRYDPTDEGGRSRREHAIESNAWSSCRENRQLSNNGGLPVGESVLRIMPLGRF
jgi:hypothetical protein